MEFEGRVSVGDAALLSVLSVSVLVFMVRISVVVKSVSLGYQDVVSVKLHPCHQMEPCRIDHVVYLSCSLHPCVSTYACD